MKPLSSYAFTLAALFALSPALPGCLGEDEPEDEFVGEDAGKNDTGLPAVSPDQLNGMWKTTLSGATQPDIMISSWTAIGIEAQIGDRKVKLTRTGDRLSGEGVDLLIKPNNLGVRDDTMEGTVDGKPAKLARNTSVQKSITVPFPKDRPWRSWLQDTIMGLAQKDRESYQHFGYYEVRDFLKSCELYGSWLSKVKGADWTERAKSFNNIINAVKDITASPHNVVGHYKFQTAVKENIVDQTQIGLLLSSWGMYFSTGAGGSLRFDLTPDTKAYFITDRVARSEKIGLVVMATPTHKPLASTFGRQLLDLAEMPVEDDKKFIKAMMDLMLKSDNTSSDLLAGISKSALVDFFAVMAIEDYRGITFGNINLAWGYNMVNTQFYGVIAKALARPGATDSTGKPVIGQVIVGSQLKPGDGSYADILNNGNDLQEYTDMATLKKHASDFLKTTHPTLVAEVEAAFAGVVPKAEAGTKAQTDVFHYITAQLFDARNRTANLKGAAADRAINAVVALTDKLRTDSAKFEAYILSKGITKANDPAPRSTGF